jgi:hypothetical protein
LPTLHPQRDRRRCERPVHGVPLAHFVGRVLHVRSRDDDLGHDLARSKGDLAGVRVGRSYEKLRSVDLAVPLCRSHLHLRAERDQRRPEAGGTDEIRRATSKDSGITILARLDEALAILGREEAVARAVVPVAGALAQVAGHGSHVSDLRAGDAPNGRSQGRELLANGRVAHQLVERDERANTHAGLVCRNAAEFLDVLMLTTRFGVSM